MKLFTTVLSLAIASMPVAATAQSQRVCISTAENEAVVGYILPSLLTKIGGKCGQTAPFLRHNAEALAGDLQQQSDAAWPDARITAQRVSGANIPGEDAGGAIAKAVLAPALADGIAKGFNEQSCTTTDRLIEQLAPLPPRNLANVLALFLELGIAGNDEVPYQVCR